MNTQSGMEKPILSELPAISDRMTFLYLEHCRISREDGAVTVRDSAIPRTCGGDPSIAAIRLPSSIYSPHMRG